MNKITSIIILATAALFFAPAKAQTNVNLAPEFGGRLTVGIDKKITKGLHITLDEEIRMADNFGSLDRLQTTLGVKYKVLPFLRLGLGYALINPFDADSSLFSSPRHRLMFDLTGMWRFGDWAFSLKERFQLTRRTGDFNEYQNPPNAMTLKSRLMLKYKGFPKVEPYAYFELRNFLNAPVIVANYDGTYYYTAAGSRKGEAGWFLDGFNGSYLNRYRASIGVDYNINRSNALKVYVLADFVTDKVVDANAEGTKLKSYTREKGFVGTIGAEYVYKF